MKLIIAYCFLCFSYTAEAFEQNTNKNQISSSYSSSLFSEINLIPPQQSFDELFSLHYGPLELKTNYSSSHIMRDPTLVSFKEQGSYLYLGSELTIHSSSNFDLSMSANIYQKTVLSNDIFSNISTPEKYIHENGFHNNLIYSSQIEPQYRLIGNYTISSYWQLSGGIIFNDFSFIWNNRYKSIRKNNIALVNTSYRF